MTLGSTEGGKSVSEIGEKRIIREIIAPLCKSDAVNVGVGDDAAVVDFPSNQQLVISCDKIPEDLLALQLGLMDAFHHGRYLATVNISDIASMGANPLGLLCTLALPNYFSVSYLDSFMRGFVHGGAEWGVPVVGGDTGWASAVCLSATVFGSIQNGRALRRNGAKPGDRLFVTGPIGGFGTALAYFVIAKDQGLRLSEDEEKWLLERLVHPVARVDMGRKLVLSGVCTSCMDITDGVGQSLRELAEASDVRLEIDIQHLPIHDITKKVAEFLKCPLNQLVFGIGLDLELLGSVAAELPASLAGLRTFGNVVDGDAGVWLGEGKTAKPLAVKGWQHFQGSALELVRSMYSAGH
jgi:thiamine-monophosphate kinase